MGDYFNIYGYTVDEYGAILFHQPFADVFVSDGGTVGIDGNELLVFDAAGLITVSGANLDLNGNTVIFDADGDSYIWSPIDDIIDVVVADAFGRFAINISGAEDFNFEANAFNVQEGSAIYQSEYRYHLGDVDTNDRFRTHRWTLTCGGVTMIDVVEAGTDTITLGGSALIVPDGFVIGVGAALERIVFDAAGDIAVMGANLGVGTESPGAEITIANGGGLLIGDDTQRSGGGGIYEFQVLGTGFLDSGMLFARYQNNAGGVNIILAKSRSGSIGGTGIVQNGDTVGNISFAADDGTDLVHNVAIIKAAIDGVPGVNDLPGRLTFQTTADGASSTTERMRIDSSGNVGIATASPGQIFDINQGSGNMIADGYDNHSLAMWKEDLMSITGEGMIDKLKSFNLFEWTRTPFVSTAEAVALAVLHFRLDLGDHSPREYFDSLALDNTIRLWIDEKRKQLQEERADLPEWTRKHIGLVADDLDTMAALPDVIGYNEKGDPTGYSLNNHVGFLHAVILDLVAEVEALKVAA